MSKLLRSKPILSLLVPLVFLANCEAQTSHPSGCESDTPAAPTSSSSVPSIGDRDYVPDDAVHPAFVSSARRLLSAPELSDAPSLWIENSLDWVNFILTAYPPKLPEPPERREALLRLDDILHIESAPKKEVVQKYYRQRLDEAITEIEHATVTQGAVVWKLYNHGFFIRTPSASFTFDIVAGTEQPGFELTTDQLHRLTAQSDATFISHWHPDHADKRVARMFLDAGKPVFAPPGLWVDDTDFFSRLTYPDRVGEQRKSRYEFPGKGGYLDIFTYPGHQGLDVLNNVYLVITKEGFIVMHTGDQYAPTPDFDDYRWIDKVATEHRVDILLVNAWTPGLARIAKGINPNLIITGHENEMFHGIAHREGYGQTYDRLFCIPFPYLVMTWGERKSYSRN